MTAVLKPRGSARRSLSRRSFAAPESTVTSIATPRKIVANGSHARARLTTLPTRADRQVQSLRQAPLTLPPVQRAPLWLQLLVTTQRGSTVVTFFLVLAALATYGWMVYAQQLWSREYRKLESLQRQERQITAADEVLKNQIALEAERPETGLTLPNPSSTIFLQPAPPRPAVADAPTASAAPIAPAEPLGY